MLDYGSNLVKGSFTQIAQAIFNIKGEPMKFTDQQYLVTGLDNINYETILFRTGRQVAKSTSLALRTVILCAALKGYQAMYVSPSFSQTKEFSRARVETLCKESPYVMQYLLDDSCAWSIQTRNFRNGSRMTFKYAFYNADRVRGHSADCCMIDEIQDILIENIPVIEQILVHSHAPSAHPEWAPFYKKKIYAGTPKSLSNTMEHFWKESTQCVWTIPCYSCREWNYLSEKSIGKNGLVCTGRIHREGHTVQCSKPIDPRNGMWHALKPEGRILAFHISQLIAPRVEWGSHGWIRWEQDILAPYELRAPGYDKVRFYNEILGLPCESALRAVTQADIMACCDEKWKLQDAPTPLTRSRELFAGVDWGETRSRTVLTIGGRFADGRWAPVFIKRYTADECEPSFLVEDILKWCNLFGVRAIACDVGHGFGMNSQLVRDFGIDRIYPVRYMGTASARLIFASKKKWEWTANRNTIMGEYFMNIKRRKVRFPRWAQWEAGGHAADLLNVFMEFSGRKKDLIYAHGVGLENADDGVHSAIYSQLAEEISRGGFIMNEIAAYTA